MKLLACKIAAVAIAIVPLSYARAASAPLAITNNVTGIEQTSATLWGVVDANGAAAVFWFEYGTSYSLGSRVATQFPPNSGRMNVSAELSGLEPSTTYYYRVVAQNALGISYGDVQQFKTDWRYTSQSISGTASGGNKTANPTSTPPAAKKPAPAVVKQASSTPAAPAVTATSTVSAAPTSSPAVQAKRGSFLANMWATVANVSGYVWFFTLLLIAIVVVTYGFFRTLRKHGHGEGHGGHDHNEEEMMGHD